MGSRFLTLEKKGNRMRTSIVYLQLFKKNLAIFSRRFVTICVDEASIHHYAPKTKRHLRLYVKKSISGRIFQKRSLYLSRIIIYMLY